MKYALLVFSLLVVMSCKEQKSSKPVSDLDANTIVNEAIGKAGGDIFENSDISFDFRNMSYRALRKSGNFTLQRSFINDNGDSIRDILDNNGFGRYINTNEVVISDSLAKLYTASVNSVHYFSLLPHGLNDNAVNKKLIGKEKIKGTTYYKVEVTFNELGGGEDFEDVFLYWIGIEDFKVDYLAYSYNEDDGKGLRFRTSFNERFINGLRFVDYDNYKPNSSEIKLTELAKQFDSGKLELLSKIELKNITVDLIK